MLSLLHRHRFTLGGLVLCLLLIFTFYFHSKGPSHVSSMKRIENVQTSHQSSKKGNVDNAVTQNLEEISIQTPPEIAESARSSLVVLETEDKEGRQLGFWSGFFVERDQVATCFCAIEGAAKGTVWLAGTQQRFRIEGITASNERHGLVILKVSDFEGQPLSLGNSDSVQNNEEVYVAGNPWLKGDESTFKLEGTVTPCIISGVHHKDSNNDFLRHLSKNTGIFLDKVFQVSVQVHTGSIGGPVLNSRGQVIGVSFRAIKEGRVLNYIIPSNYLKTLLVQATSPKPLAERKPPSAFAYIAWAITKFEQERYESAIVDYDQAIKLKPDFAEAYNLRGTAKYHLRAYKSAIVDFAEAIKLKPETVESNSHLFYAYSHRGLAKSDLGDYKSAIADYNEAIRLYPGDAQVYSNRGLAKSLLGDYKSAIADYNKAIQLNPDFAETYSKRGFANLALGEYESALADSDKAIQLDPNQAAAYFNKGRVKSALGEYESALAAYNEAIRLRPEVVEAHIGRGKVKFGLGAYPAAIVDFDEVLRLNPDHTEIYRRRGTSKFLIGTYNSAIADFDEVLRLDPDNARAYFKRGMTKFMLGHISEAKSEFHNALKLARQLGDEVLQYTIEQMPQTDEDLKTFIKSRTPEGITLLMIALSFDD